MEAADKTTEPIEDLTTCSSSNLSLTQASSEPDREDYYADIGFLFDGLESTSTLKRFAWGCAENKHPQVRVALHVVDDVPGAV